MGFDSHELLGLLDVALGMAKDKAFADALIEVQKAQREYLIAEADANREKVRGIINSMVELDISTKQLEYEYKRIQPVLTSAAQMHFDKIFASLRFQRNHLLQEKNSVRMSLSFPNINREHVNGTELFPGDILAASRKAGLYQHFAVYVGDYRVIHYAAEHGDFSGKITIHEAPFSEFQSDSTFVYALDFPDNSGRPIRRGSRFGNSTPFAVNEEEAPFFNLIRETEYHLYSPEETVARAKSRLGEEKYALPFNNCEHFALWCKTGVHESHQVNKWITRLGEFARRYN